MKFAYRVMLVMSLALLLAACAKDTQIQTPSPAAAPPADNTTPPQVDRLNPRDHTDPRNLDNPDSLLSQRVIYFDFDSSVIRQRGRDIIAAHAAYAGANASARITLEGHADERGSREYNLGLGERRGNAVQSVMNGSGVGSSQMKVVSYGEERPTCSSSSEGCLGQNRRVEILYTSR